MTSCGKEARQNALQEVPRPSNQKNPACSWAFQPPCARPSWPDPLARARHGPDRGLFQRQDGRHQCRRRRRWGHRCRRATSRPLPEKISAGTATGGRAESAGRRRRAPARISGQPGAEGRHGAGRLRLRPPGGTAGRPPQARLWHRRFRRIGSLEKDVAFCTTWHTSPAKTPEEAKRTVVTVAGTGAGSGTDTDPAVLTRS